MRDQLPAQGATPTDEDLLALVARQGAEGQAAFLALYDRYGATVYGLALRVVGQPPVAEEITQDVLLKIWQQPNRWNPALGRFPAWLQTTARNAAIDRLRRDRRLRELEPLPTGDEGPEPASAPSPLDDPLWATGQDLRRLIAQLTPDQQQLLELAYYRGHSHSELAAMLGIPLGTVKTRVRAAILHLRALWEENARQAHPLARE